MGKFTLAFVAAALVCVAASFYLRMGEVKLVNQVKFSEVELYCHTNKGMHKINPEDVSDLHDNLWSFKDGGYSSNCLIINLNTNE